METISVRTTLTGLRGKPSWDSSETSSSTKGMVNVKTKQSFIGMASTLDNSWSLEAAHTHLQKFLELEL